MQQKFEEPKKRNGILNGIKKIQEVKLFANFDSSAQAEGLKLLTNAGLKGLSNEMIH